MDILSDVNVSGNLTIGHKSTFGHKLTFPEQGNDVILYKQHNSTIRICGVDAKSQLSVQSFCIGDNMAALQFSSSMIYFWGNKLIFEKDGIYFKDPSFFDNKQSIIFKTTNLVVPPNCSHFEITSEVKNWPAIASVWEAGKQIEIDLRVTEFNEKQSLLGTIVPPDAELHLSAIYLPN